MDMDSPPPTMNVIIIGCKALSKFQSRIGQLYLALFAMEMSLKRHLDNIYISEAHSHVNVTAAPARTEYIPVAIMTTIVWIPTLIVQLRV